MLKTINRSVLRILENSLEDHPPDKKECCELLSAPEHSLEAGALVAVADQVSRRRFGNNAVLLGQIGIETAPCPGKCAFCSLGADHTAFTPGRLTIEQILDRGGAFTERGDLYGLFLMTTHEFDFPWLLEVANGLRRTIPSQTRIMVNIGDLENGQGDELRSAGVSGAYHIRRLREGIDTAFDPGRRMRSLEIIREAGLDLYYCCEPIGPEHTAEELVEQMFIGIDFGCCQHAAMRRVHVPGTPLAVHGQITERRLAQVTAVVALASLGCAETKGIAVHEPNLLGLCAGANAVYAETGSNPRDTAAETAGRRGIDMDACRRMVYEAGFTALLHGDDQASPLDPDTFPGSPPLRMDANDFY